MLHNIDNKRQYWKYLLFPQFNEHCRDIRDELAYNTDELPQMVQQNVEKFNQEQEQVFNAALQK